MRIRKITIVLRKDGFFHWSGRLIKAVYPREGYVVMVFLEPSPIDDDFATYIWVPSVEELREIKRKLDKSDDLTHNLLGHGWGGKRPFWKLYEFM
jgi:hypothetical protein